MYIGHLHIHSRYSRATSKDCTPEYLDLWARKKGIDILGTGDFTHPAWREELKEKLEPAKDGLYVLKKEYQIKEEGVSSRQPRFVVTGEISSIYKKNDRVRKVHSLLILPGLEEAEALARRLELIGNIHSDGRPILGLPCRDLLEILLETTPRGIYVPAHIWTPHFSMFGAFSGFDAIEECFEELTPHIHALETGLSADPPMIWRVSALDRFCLISNSDAHSPAKLGREASLFDIELSYEGLYGAIQEGKGLSGTIEFFPEEGKYHFDGHRKCGLCISPAQTAGYGNKCPVCGKKITIGVLNRIDQLADRQEGFELPSGRPFESMVPLLEVIGASEGISAAGKKAQEKYAQMLRALGPEFAILREIPVEDIKREAGFLVAEGIRRLRSGQVERTPGFDGEYGKISLLTAGDRSVLEGQLSFLGEEDFRGKKPGPEGKRQPGKPEKGQDLQGTQKPEIKQKPGGGRENPGPEETDEAACPAENTSSSQELSRSQQRAVEQTGRAVAVIAGPGAGKTRTLIARLRYLLEVREISPEEITAVTFTHKAAKEMETRMADGKKHDRAANGAGVLTGTFHAVCSRFLKDRGMSFLMADKGLQEELAEAVLRENGVEGNIRELKESPGEEQREKGPGEKASWKSVRKDSVTLFLRKLSQVKNGLREAEEEEKPLYQRYQKLLEEAKALDYDDLLLETLQILEEIPEDAPERKPFSYLLIDEFQDINPLQYRLVREWSRGGRELFVIGDPDQSIYGFRGCDPQVFSRLGEEYPGLVTIRLEENYRCAPAILHGALGVISRNEGGERRMEARRKGQQPVRMVSAEDERGEAVFVAKEINRQVGGMDMRDTDEKGAGEGGPVRGFSDMAVLYRTHRQAALLEKCLRQEGIPYQVAGREDFLTEREVRAALYFFRYLLKTQAEASEKLSRRLLKPWLGEPKEERFTYLTGKYRKKVRRTRPVRLLEEWEKEFSFENREVMKKLADMSVFYSAMGDFLDSLTFGEDGDVRRNGGRKYSADTVTLMTLHGSKGLEFPVVFLYGMDRGRFPLEFAGGEADLEEERRLCYVGMTRAREELILVGSGEGSCFLKEIPGEEVRRETARKEEERAEQAVQMRLSDIFRW